MLEWLDVNAPSENYLGNPLKVRPIWYLCRFLKRQASTFL
jgi:hypothetical protein